MAYSAFLWSAEFTKICGVLLGICELATNLFSAADEQEKLANFVKMKMEQYAAKSGENIDA